MIYAMSDIHGCYNEFLEMLDKINFSPADELYIIGDVVDRGPQPIGLLRYIMNCENMHLLMGNHEKMMLDAITDKNGNLKKAGGCNMNLWYRNGGNITNEQFMVLSKEEQERIFRYLKQLPLGLEVFADGKQYILIHGGPTINFVEEWDAGELDEGILWERFESCSSDEIVYPGKITVVGHTPTFLYGVDDSIIKIGDKRLIDCGCVFGHTLGCMRLGDENCFSVKKKKH